MRSHGVHMLHSYDLLFQCNTLDRDPRSKIWQEMTQKETGPIPVNYAPLGALDTVKATAKGIFAVSPSGTGEIERSEVERIV